MSQEDKQDSIIDVSETTGFTSIEHVNLEDSQACKQAISKLDSPRTLEALKILGLWFEELLPIDFEE